MALSISSLKKKLSKQPANTALLGALGDLYRNQGKLPLAIESYTRLVQIDPHNYQILNNLGALQRNAGDADSSLTTLLKANKILPNNPIILTNLANTFLNLGRSDLAIESCEQAVKLQTDFFDSHEMLGNAYIAAGKYNKAIISFNQALKIRPKDKSIIIAIARTNHLLGDNESAYKILHSVLKPPSPECAILLFNISKSLDKQKEALDYFHQLQKPKDDKDAAGYATLHFCLAKYYNETGLYEKSINAYHLANKKCNRQFDINETRQHFTNIINAFPVKEINNEQLSNIQTEKPVFILGMPRSGTSLVEQILASHPDIFGAGELPNIDISVKEAKSINGEKFPISIANLRTKDLNNTANKYLAHLTKISNNENKVTDKMPHNFMHIGFILKLFPSAQIIHCRRHPMDTTLSCYFADFGNNGHNYAYNLNNLGKYYLEYHRLMEHWLQLHSNNIHNIYYEDLITKTIPTCKKLIATCNLEWDDRCLDFHKTKRNIHTLSYDQVNKPIYSASMYRWKNYGTYITKLSDTLSEISQRYEYELENSSLDK